MRYLRICAAAPGGYVLEPKPASSPCPSVLVAFIHHGCGVSGVM